MSRFDLVIAAGTVVDGNRGAEPTSADVGITDGLIAAVGDLAAADRTRTIDAAGRVVAPGFIDTHTHVEMASLIGHADRFAPIAQGVTTTLCGLDGFGWVGLADEDRDRWWQDMAAIYGPPLSPQPAWPSPLDYVRQLDAASPTSVVPLVPHGNVRAAVMGSARGPASPSQMRAMREMVIDWFDAGAVGMASGLDYLPGRFAETDELVELCEVMAPRGGVYATHMRISDLGRAGAWREAGEIARRSGAPLRISHERLDEEAARLLDEVSAHNDVTVDSYLYPAGCTSLAYHVPAGDLIDGVIPLVHRLEADRGFAAELAGHLDQRLTGTPGQEAIVAATTSGRFEGRKLSSLASERGTTVGEVAVELLRDEMPCALLIYVWQNPDAEWEATVARTLADDRTLIASDGVYLGSNAHPRGFGVFPRVLGEFVRRQSLISLEDAVHKMTGKPADAYGLTDRGRIEPGLRADVTVFDRAVVDGPGDYENPRRSPVGIDIVLINGNEQKWR
jgi:N-acyl-D-aspartate/D-glutamate deacylase